MKIALTFFMAFGLIMICKAGKPDIKLLSYDNANDLIDISTFKDVIKYDSASKRYFVPMKNWLENDFYYSTNLSNQAISHKALNSLLWSAECTVSVGGVCVSNDGNFFYTDGSYLRDTRKLLTKDSLMMLTAFINLNQNYPSFANKAGNRLIMRKDLTISISINTNYQSGAGGYCIFPPTGFITLYSTPSLTKVYTDANLTTPFAGSSFWFYVSPFNWFAIQIDVYGNVINKAPITCP